MNPPAGAPAAYLAERLAGMDFNKVSHKVWGGGKKKKANSDTVWLFGVSDACAGSVFH